MNKSFDAKQIRFEDISRQLTVEEVDKKYRLRFGKAKPIIISLPFILNKEIAKLCGMMPDGYLSKDFSCISFTQGKDVRKVREFGSILEKRFSVTPRYYKKERYMTVTASNKSLCFFLHHFINIHKSDEIARIPKWVTSSDTKIIREYLRYAFAMEASISDPLKGEKEIKFHSCDKEYLLQLSDIMLKTFGIKSYLLAYKIRNYGEKYYLFITNEENITKFREIGFALKSHQKRLEKIVSSYKNKAWEITLVSIPKLRMQTFSIKDVNKLFPYISKRAIFARLNSLVKLGFLVNVSGSYELTKGGMDQIEKLCNIHISKLRTCPKENEKIILSILDKESLCISDVSRKTGIHVKTVRDVLRRLEKQRKIFLKETDKFQRKIYEKIREADSGGSPKI